MTSIKTRSILFIFFSLIFICLVKSSMIINLTPSMPLGIYFEKKKNITEQGDIVAACLPSKL